MTIRVAINGFGRMGRNFLRAVYASQKDIEIVCINDLASPEVLAHMTRYDSIIGTFPKSVSHTDKAIRIDDKVIRTSAETDPARLPWKSFAIDVVLEATGRFTKAADARNPVRRQVQCLMLGPCDRSTQNAQLTGIFAIRTRTLVSTSSFLT